MTMREEVEAELETIRGIRINRWQEKPFLDAEVVITLIDPAAQLPPFPKPAPRWRGLMWYALAFAAWCGLVWMVKA